MLAGRHCLAPEKCAGVLLYLSTPSCCFHALPSCTRKVHGYALVPLNAFMLLSCVAVLHQKSAWLCSCTSQSLHALLSRTGKVHGYALAPLNAFMRCCPAPEKCMGMLLHLSTPSCVAVLHRKSAWVCSCTSQRLHVVIHSLPRIFAVELGKLACNELCTACLSFCFVFVPCVLMASVCTTEGCSRQTCQIPSRT
jgi:hypothetical protein